MVKQLVCCLLVILVSAVVVNAHGNATHLMGTITAIEGNHVTLKDKDGKSVMVMLDKTTKYLKDKKAATSSDLKVGTRVVIDAEIGGPMKMYMAQEVQIGTSTGGETPANASSGPANADPHAAHHK